MADLPLALGLGQVRIAGRYTTARPPRLPLAHGHASPGDPQPRIATLQRAGGMVERGERGSCLRNPRRLGTVWGVKLQVLTTHTPAQRAAPGRA